MNNLGFSQDDSGNLKEQLEVVLHELEKAQEFMINLVGKANGAIFLLDSLPNDDIERDHHLADSYLLAYLDQTGQGEVADAYRAIAKRGKKGW